jgi:DNA-binding FadR family transcriptional regulator
MFSILIDSIAGALQDMRRLVFNVPGAPHQGQLEHRVIYEAVATHNADAARETMRKHLERAKNDIDTASRQLGAEQRRAS